MTKFLLTVAAVLSFSAASYASYNYACQPQGSGSAMTLTADTNTVSATSTDFGTCTGNLVAGASGFLRATMGGAQCTSQFDLMVQRPLLRGANGYVMIAGNSFLCSRN